MTTPERGSLDQLVARHYDELRHLAHRFLRRERSDLTLQTTGLVNEAYLRLANLAGIRPDERTRFFALASTTMRRVLVDHARGRSRQKRGAAPERVPLDEVEWMLTDEEAEELVVLDETLSRLEQINPRGSEVVQYRFFGGLTLEETAEVLDVSTKTVQRDWLAARAWLRKEVAKDLGFLGADVQDPRDSAPS
ncbi:MAG TPA: ECF-type sigma factor [Gemmatimonadaceae bacterium]|nr:ECF-type sigma factor [Gemmatimonadaceae bacterium]